MKTINRVQEGVINPFMSNGNANNCRIKGNRIVYGFEAFGSDYYFHRKSDAVAAAQWIESTSWDGLGDLECCLLDARIDLGRVCF